MVKLVTQSMKISPAGQAAADNRPLDQPETGAVAHAKLGREFPVIGGYRFIGGEDEPHCQRHVEEHMRDQNTGNAIDIRLERVSHSV